MQLKKDNSDIAPFPPKRVRNSQPRVLEQRRAALELYIQKMLKLLATKQQVLSFLGIENPASDVSYARYNSRSSNSCRNFFFYFIVYDRMT